MTSQTLTLADFLLARIEEDETDARRGVGWADRATRWGRMLAECEAKRRIVALHHDSTDEWSDGTTTTGCANCIWAGNDGREYVHDGPCATLRLLALPYADHADYRDEWRP